MYGDGISQAKFGPSWTAGFKKRYGLTPREAIESKKNMKPVTIGVDGSQTDGGGKCVNDTADLDNYSDNHLCGVPSFDKHVNEGCDDDGDNESRVTNYEGHGHTQRMFTLNWSETDRGQQDEGHQESAFNYGMMDFSSAHSLDDP